MPGTLNAVVAAMTMITAAAGVRQCQTIDSYDQTNTARIQTNTVSDQTNTAQDQSNTAQNQTNATFGQQGVSTEPAQGQQGVSTGPPQITYAGQGVQWCVIWIAGQHQPECGFSDESRCFAEAPQPDAKCVAQTPQQSQPYCFVQYIGADCSYSDVQSCAKAVQNSNGVGSCFANPLWTPAPRP